MSSALDSGWGCRIFYSKWELLDNLAELCLQLPTKSKQLSPMAHLPWWGQEGWHTSEKFFMHRDPVSYCCLLLALTALVWENVFPKQGLRAAAPHHLCPCHPPIQLHTAMLLDRALLLWALLELSQSQSHLEPLHKDVLGPSGARPPMAQDPISGLWSHQPLPWQWVLLSQAHLWVHVPTWPQPVTREVLNTQGWSFPGLGLAQCPPAAWLRAGMVGQALAACTHAGHVTPGVTTCDSMWLWVVPRIPSFCCPGWQLVPWLQTLAVFRSTDLLAMDLRQVSRHCKMLLRRNTLLLHILQTIDRGPSLSHRWFIF